MGWQELAVWAADTAGVDRRIVLATVEAETGGRNIMGDGGDSYGFGQVQLQYASHWNAMVKAAQQTDVIIPWASFGQSDKTALKNSVLSDDWFSMLLAANVIKAKWEGAGGNWDTFTSYYVGAGIPVADRERRRKIWDKWQSVNVSGIGYPGVASGGSQGASGGAGGILDAAIDGNAIILTGAVVVALIALLGGGKD